MKELSLSEALVLNRQRAGTVSSSVYVIANYGAAQFRIFLQAYLAQAGINANLIAEEYGSFLPSLLKLPKAAPALLLLDSDTLAVGSSLRSFGSFRKSPQSRSIRKDFLKTLSEFLTLHEGPVTLLPLRLDSPLFHCLPETVAGEIDLEWSQAIVSLLELTKTHPNFMVAQAPRPEVDEKRFLETGEPLFGKTASQQARLVSDLMTRQLTVTGTTKKLLVTDLDGTFWSGILGDDGEEALEFGPEGKGKIHWVYQRFLDLLSSEGVILAIASKNSSSLVENAFSKLPLHCPANRFSMVEAQWGPKSTSIRNICKSLNLSPSDVVFVDDNPSELSEVSLSIPGITCLHFPESQDELVPFLASLRKEFTRDRPATGVETRLQSYRALAEMGQTQEATADNAQTIEKHLASLQMELSLEWLQPSYRARVFELLNKTNQFNLNGARYSDAEWSQVVAQSQVLTFRLKDKFADHGLIGAAIVDNAQNLNQLVLSCRVFSRRIEDEVLRFLISPAVGIKTIAYQATPRNAPTGEFLTRALGPVAGKTRITIGKKATLSPFIGQVVEPGAFVSADLKASLTRKTG